MTMNFVAPLVSRVVSPPDSRVMVKDDTRGWLVSNKGREKGSNRKISVPYVALLERVIPGEVRRARRRQG